MVDCNKADCNTGRYTVLNFDTLYQFNNTLFFYNVIPETKIQNK